MTQVQRPHGTYNVFPCDLCGMDDPAEIEVARCYTNDQPLHVCKNCGFVYVRERRSAQDIADSWTNEIYQSSYTARIPAVKARQMFVAETIDTTIGLKDSRLCDIGGGEGQFLQMASSAEYGAKAFAIEPSAGNCAKLTTLGIESFHGTIEEFIAADDGTAKFDIATIMWTLENCQNCRTMLDAAYALLKPGGHLVIATGSRILVPFKKPLNLYLSHQVADAHCFRLSASTLEGLLAISGFKLSTGIAISIRTFCVWSAGRPIDRRKFPGPAMTGRQSLTSSSVGIAKHASTMPTVFPSGWITRRNEHAAKIEDHRVHSLSQLRGISGEGGRQRHPADRAGLGAHHHR